MLETEEIEIPIGLAACFHNQQHPRVKTQLIGKLSSQRNLAGCLFKTKKQKPKKTKKTKTHNKNTHTKKKKQKNTTAKKQKKKHSSRSLFGLRVYGLRRIRRRCLPVWWQLRLLYSPRLVGEPRELREPRNPSVVAKNRRFLGGFWRKTHRNHSSKRRKSKNSWIFQKSKETNPRKNHRKFPKKHFGQHWPFWIWLVVGIHICNATEDRGVNVELAPAQ